MKKSIAVLAAAGAALAVAAPAHADTSQRGVATIIACTDNPTGSIDRPREIRECISNDIDASIAQLQTCDDGLFGNPESIREFYQCVLATALD
jgi:hypothetical protein